MKELDIPEGDLFSAECSDCGNDKYLLLLTEDKELFCSECTKCGLRGLLKDAVLYTGKLNPTKTYN